MKDSFLGGCGKGGGWMGWGVGWEVELSRPRKYEVQGSEAGRREPGVVGEQQGSRYGRNGASKGKQRVQALRPLCEVFGFCSEMGHQWRAVSRGLEE